MKYLAYAHLVCAFICLGFFFKVWKTGRIIKGESTIGKSLFIVASFSLWYTTGATLAFMVIAKSL